MGRGCRPKVTGVFRVREMPSPGPGDASSPRSCPGGYRGGDRAATNQELVMPVDTFCAFFAADAEAIEQDASEA